MTITPIKVSGKEMALCGCDACAAEVSISAIHGDNQPGSTRGRPKLTILHEHKVRADLARLRWSTFGKKILCPACVAKANTKSEPPEQAKGRAEAMTNVTEIRKPTREQRRAIIALLDECYDVKAGRYKGAETDVTIADAVGGGCMFGWVTEIRVETYGDSGDNEESGKLVADLAALLDRVTAVQTEAAATKLEVSRALDRVNAMSKTLGPKGRAVS